MWQPEFSISSTKYTHEVSILTWTRYEYNLYCVILKKKETREKAVPHRDYMEITSVYKHH